jgi:hypothetical protein
MLKQLIQVTVFQNMLILRILKNEENINWYGENHIQDNDEIVLGM